MKNRVVGMLVLLCIVVQGAWAQTWKEVSKETLVSSITNNAYLKLTEDIELGTYLNIEGKTVTIDLNGHKLSRNLTQHGSAGHVIYVHSSSNNSSTLTLTSSVAGGSIEGGKANNGGAINITHGNTVRATNVTFQNNSAAQHAGAVWNNGTFEATECVFQNNSANDVGGIYNAVTDDGAGSATLTRCTFTGNTGTTGAGALANALGATEMTIDRCSITDNTAGCDGGAGIWNGGTLNMKGNITVKDNMNVSGVASNVYLKNGTVITVTGSLTGSHIGVDMESVAGTFTSGYSSNSSIDPKTIFTADRSIMMDVGQNGGEAELYSWYPATTLTYIERSWDSTNKKVISTEKILSSLVAYGYIPDEGMSQYKEVTNPPTDKPNQWFGMGGYSTTVPEYYVVRGDVNRQTIVVQGTDVHLVLCDGATLTLTGGLKLEGDNKLYIHCQSYGNDMGKLIVDNEYEGAAGIGSAWDNGAVKPAGELVIYGGDLDVEGGSNGAGIGSCSISDDYAGEPLCNRVTVYGGNVKVKGGRYAAGIGGGCGINGGDFILYGGTVNVEGGSGTYDQYTGDSDDNGGAGIGGGHGGYGGNVTVYGGTLTADGDTGGAGIGSAPLAETDGNAHELRGGTFTMYGGTVTAIGHWGGAGIGGGENSGAAEVFIYGGTVTATGNRGGAGIGGGNGSDSYGGNGGRLTISGGTVTATGGYGAAGIGGGSRSCGAIVTINGGTVTANGGSWAPGIGGGYNHNKVCNTDGGTLTISGGTVTATGGENGTGIGGGYKGGGGDVTITGGTVIAKAGTQGAEYRAIGPGNDCNIFGTLTIGNAMMVGAGNSGSVERTYDADERKNACWYRSYAEISPCTHPAGLTYTINNDGTHTSHCKHCTVTETAEHVSAPCVCGYNSGAFTITIATSSGGIGYDGVDVVAYVGSSQPYTLPVCTTIPEGYDFAGWVVNPQNHDNGIQPKEGETLWQAGENIEVMVDVTIAARYQPLAISLADNGDNGEKLYTYNGRKAATVTLAGRTLWKTGDWNTLCLPFSLTAEQLAASPLAGATIKTLVSSGFNSTNGTLSLNFTADENNLTAIEAGKPYIVKWNATTPNYIENPVFNNVTITNSTPQAVPAEPNALVTFEGSYNPRAYTKSNPSVLYLAAGNSLYYPNSALTINACRAVFRLNGITAGDLTNARLYYGEESTGISELANWTIPRYDNSSDNGQIVQWFTLDGRCLSGKPTTKGIYLRRGQKVVVK